MLPDILSINKGFINIKNINESNYKHIENNYTDMSEIVFDESYWGFSTEKCDCCGGYIPNYYLLNKHKYHVCSMKCSKSLSMSIRNADPEFKEMHRELLRKIATEQYKDPDFMERHRKRASERLHNRWGDPNYVKKMQKVQSNNMSILNDKQWKDPKHREEMSEKLRERMSEFLPMINQTWYFMMSTYEESQELQLYYTKIGESDDYYKIGITKDVKSRYAFSSMHSNYSYIEEPTELIKGSRNLIVNLEYFIKLNYCDKSKPFNCTELFKKEYLNEIIEQINIKKSLYNDSYEWLDYSI